MPTRRAPSKGMLIGYARVSTIDQNLALQRDALNEAGCGKIFTEQLSGAVTDRPALRDALEFARSGDTLIVWKLDRLARSMKQLIETIEKLRLKNIGFRSLTEALDTTTAQGRLVFHMFGALAEFERSLIRERTQAGLAAARRIGRTGGRPPKLTDDDIEAAKAMSSPASDPLACVDLSMPEGLIGGRGGKCFNRAISSFAARCSTRSFANDPTSFLFSARIRVTSPIRSRTTPIRSACVKRSNESGGGRPIHSLNHTSHLRNCGGARNFPPE
jgi:hypothetical protein